MDPKTFRARHGQEHGIQKKFVAFLEKRGWLVERLVGNAYQMGLPDLFIGHPRYGCRWLEIKVYNNYTFTKAQRLKFPVFEEFGVGIWILGAESVESCTKEHIIQEYSKLQLPPNWREFWKPSYELPNIDEMMGEL